MKEYANVSCGFAPNLDAVCSLGYLPNDDRGPDKSPIFGNLDFNGRVQQLHEAWKLVTDKRANGMRKLVLVDFNPEWFPFLHRQFFAVLRCCSHRQNLSERNAGSHIRPRQLPKMNMRGLCYTHKPYIDDMNTTLAVP